MCYRPDKTRPYTLKIPTTLRYDSDSSEDDDETSDNFKNEIGLKGEKEQMENVEIHYDHYKIPSKSISKYGTSKVLISKGNISETILSASDLNDLKKIMGKVQPLLNHIKNVYKSPLNHTLSVIVEIKAPSGPVANASGTPPPAPPLPPPPPGNLYAPNQEIKIRKHGATLTANHSDGFLSNIEIKIKMSNKEDELSP